MDTVTIIVIEYIPKEGARESTVWHNMIPGTQLESASLIYYKLKVTITKARNITPNFSNHVSNSNVYTTILLVCL